MKIVIILGSLAVACFFAYVRLTPSDVVRWHVHPAEELDPGKSGVLKRISGDLTAFDLAVKGEPRASQLAGSIDQGRITYVIRSRIWGFPDYLTVAQDGDDLVILSRLRFGKHDLGVNSARLKRILQRLQSF